MESKDGISVPSYGYKLRLDHEFPEKWSPDIKISLLNLFKFIPFVLRYTIMFIVFEIYIWYIVKCIWDNKEPIMNPLCPVKAQQIYGVPIGGIGGGTIGRGFRGEFCRYTLRPGITEYNTVDANQFIITIKNGKKQTIFQSLLSTYEKKTLRCWKSLIDPSKCQYTGLYPRAWTEYDLTKYGIKLICRQISPVIPHNYKDTSLPCAIFVWNIENTTSEELTVTISFTFKNGTSNKSPKESGNCQAEGFSSADSEGIIMHQEIYKMNCSYALAARTRKNINVSKCLYFDPNSDGSGPWNDLYRYGSFDNTVDKSSKVYKEMACGVAAQVSVNSKDTQNVEFCLVWDMPKINFFLNTKKYFRYYTRFFGREDACLRIVEFAFNNYTNWERAIHTWQEPILNDRLEGTFTILATELYSPYGLAKIVKIVQTRLKY